MSSKIPAERIRLKRAYEKPSDSDGTRILVDRLWPRGVKKDEAAIDHWEKEIAPSTELRKWFHHEAEHWDEFRRRYAAELDNRQEEMDRLRSLARKGVITLIYSARDETQNNATALRDLLLEA